MSSGPWTDVENDLIVADHFVMLADDLAGRAYGKADRNRRLRERIVRSRGSVEYKHQNISAVLLSLGEAWIPGYKPAFDIQSELVDAVQRWLARHPAWLARLPSAAPTSGLGEAAPLWVGPSPTMSNEPPPAELAKMLRIAHQYDAAGRDERNRVLGRAGEERVLAHERSTLRGAGRDDLAQEVRWVADLDGDGAGYDIASFTPAGRPRLIEVRPPMAGSAHPSTSRGTS